MNYSNKLPDDAPALPLAALEAAFRQLWSKTDSAIQPRRQPPIIVSPDFLAHLQAEELPTYAERCTAHELVGYRRRKAAMAAKRSGFDWKTWVPEVTR